MENRFGVTGTLSKSFMDTVKIEDVRFYNLRKLADAKNEVGEDAPLELLIAAYEKRAGFYTVEKPAVAEKKVTKKTTKKTTRAKAKK